MHSRTAFIAGATGAVGSHVLAHLLAQPDYNRVATLVRRPLTRHHDKLQVTVGSFDELERHAPLLDVDDVFCCLGTTLRKAGSRQAFERVDHDYVVQLAELAANSHARQFLMISAVGADPESSFFYSRVKGRTEQAVKALPFDAIHILQPSLLLGPRDERRLGESMAKTLMPMLNPLLRGRLAKYRGVQASEVARRMVDWALQGATGTHVHQFG